MILTRVVNAARDVVETVAPLLQETHRRGSWMATASRPGSMCTSEAPRSTGPRDDLIDRAE